MSLGRRDSCALQVRQDKSAGELGLQDQCATDEGRRSVDKIQLEDFWIWNVCDMLPAVSQKVLRWG